MSYNRPVARKDSIGSRWLEARIKTPDERRSSSPQPIVLPRSSSPHSPGEVAALALQLQSSYSHLSREDLVRLINRFYSIPTMTPGRVTKSAAIAALQGHHDITYDRARETVKQVRSDATGSLELEEWLELAARARSESPSTMVPGKQRGTLTIRRTDSDASHTIDEDERAEYTNFINSVLAGDPDLHGRLPVPTDTMQIFEECRDGLIICKLIEHGFPGTISRILRPTSGGSRRTLNIPNSHRSLNHFQTAENTNVAVAAARAIGCSVVNIGGQDISEGREHLILGLIRQIIQLGLLRKVDLNWHPELVRLCEPGESLDALRKMPAEQVLLRWINYHLAASGRSRRVSNFQKDLIDGECYLILLHQLKPHICTLDGLSKTDARSRADAVLQNADRIDCRKYITVRSLLDGNPRLNLAFVANLFNIYPGLEPPTPDPPIPAAPLSVTSPVVDDAPLPKPSMLRTRYQAQHREQQPRQRQPQPNGTTKHHPSYIAPTTHSRTETHTHTIKTGARNGPSVLEIEPTGTSEAERQRIIDLQLNSAFMERGTYSLFEDLKGGIIILQALEKVSPGAVMWTPGSKSKHPKTSGLRPTSTGTVPAHATGQRSSGGSLNTNIGDMGMNGVGMAMGGQRRALLYTRTPNGLKA